MAFVELEQYFKDSNIDYTEFFKTYCEGIRGNLNAIARRLGQIADSAGQIILWGEE